MTRKRISNSERKKRKKEKKNSEISTVFGAFDNGQIVEFDDDEEIEFLDGFWQELEKSVKELDE
ncbi:MAG: hypothetical protein SVO01_09820 [Thermotogota bacterium]|nr:hypothetical protein [Thermotogota bacterium]